LLFNNNLVRVFTKPSFYTFVAELENKIIRLRCISAIQLEGQTLHLEDLIVQLARAQSTGAGLCAYTEIIKKRKKKNAFSALNGAVLSGTDQQ
jgi:hypothetical protein